MFICLVGNIGQHDIHSRHEVGCLFIGYLTSKPGVLRLDKAERKSCLDEQEKNEKVNFFQGYEFTIYYAWDYSEKSKCRHQNTEKHHFATD